MTDQELREIERKLVESCSTNYGTVEDWWTDRDSDYVLVKPPDIRALIAEVRRLRSALGHAYGALEVDGTKPLVDYATDETIWSPPEKKL